MRIARPSSILTTLALAVVVGGGASVVGWEAAREAGVWVGLIPFVLILWRGGRRPLRRWRLARTDMPSVWRDWLHDHVVLYRRLDAPGRERFERDVRFVLGEYSFEGVRGVTVTDELRLSVAAGVACLLHGRPAWELPGSRSVLFYPDRFDDTYYGGVSAHFDGMAHQQGPIILTAPSVRGGWARTNDGDNVVLHELAHLFDFDNEGADGVPSLVAPGSAPDWQALVRAEMRRVEQGRSVLRPYAAEAPSEFFAVAVESFFEQPERLAQHHGALFRALTAFFQLDPRTGAWGADAIADGDEAPASEPST